jgi:hypothetical protein
MIEAGSESGVGERGRRATRFVTAPAPSNFVTVSGWTVLRVYILIYSW